MVANGPRGTRPRRPSGGRCTTGTGLAPSAAESSLDKKLEASIACINSLSGQFYRARASYFSTVDPVKGPDQKVTTWMGTVTDQQNDLAALQAAIAVTPAVADLDASMTAYVAAAKEVFPVIEEAHTYYDKKANLDDAGAKGKTLHPTLVAGFQKFATAAKSLSDIVAAKNRARRVADLEKLAKNPAMHGEYIFGNVMLLAEDVVALGEGPFDTLDLPALTTATAALEKAAGDLEAYYTAKTEPQIKSFNRVSTDLKNYVNAALALVRRKRDSKGFDATEQKTLASQAARLVEGSGPNLIENYNSLINSSNGR